MNLYPTALTGELVPGKLDPRFVKGIDTNRRMGVIPLAPPRFDEPTKKQPLDVGEKRHHELLDAIKGLNVEQKATQISEALEENRDWRT